jgi:hypothetical protein
LEAGCAAAGPPSATSDTSHITLRETSLFDMGGTC